MLLLHPRRTHGSKLALLFVFAATTLLGSALVGCDSDNVVGCDGGLDAAACRRRTDGSTDGNTVFDTGRGPRPDDLLSLRIEPQDRTIQVDDGMSMPVDYVVTGVQRDGMTRTVTSGIRFQIDQDQLGMIDAVSGRFTASGFGGVLRVRASALDGSGLTVDTGLTINVRRTVLGMGVTDAAEARRRFEMAVNAADEATTRPVINYPLARAVMPRNVFPPQIMWTPRHTQTPMDLIRVRLARPHATVEAYVVNAAGFNHAWRPAQDVFRNLSETEVGRDIVISVSILSGSFVRESATSAFRTIDGVVAGSVYYWSPPRGRVLRIDVDTATRVDFLPNPPGGCIACHTVSRDGGRMLGVTDNGRPTTSYDLRADLRGSPPAQQWNVPANMNFVASFNGDATRAVTGVYSGGPLSLLNTTNGQPIPGSPGNGFHPTWSPDSRDIAWATAAGALMLTGMTGDTVGAQRMLLAAEPGLLNMHPTWSPDSNWLSIQRGGPSITLPTSGSGALWMLNRDGTMPARLTNASGGAMTTNSWRPVFSPFNSGGYFWLLFTSSRDYGNAQAGVRSTKLIWVAAVRNNPTMYCAGMPAGMCDPSEVAYFMDGQENATNLDPYWAPAPCRMNATGCSTGADCCSGSCEPDAVGQRVCVPPRMRCRARGETCSTNSDCCMGTVCTEGRICDNPPIG